MRARSRSVQQIIDEQVKKWEIMRTEKEKERAVTPVITVSREPGSGGRIVAERIAQRLGLDFFHREIIQKMAESADISTRVVETLDEKGISVLDDWMSTLVNKRHLWPDQYLKHLMKVIVTIGRHGGAVIVGRGASFILPPEGRFRTRIVAPLEIRLQNVARDFAVTLEEAKYRVLRAESDRRAFVRKYFRADIGSTGNYDLVINTGTLGLEGSVGAIIGALGAEKGSFHIENSKDKRPSSLLSIN